MKRIEVYTQTKVKLNEQCPGHNYYPERDIAKHCLEVKQGEKYFWPLRNGIIGIYLRCPDSSNRVRDATELTIEIIPQNAKLPKELSDLLKDHHFVKK